MPERIARRQALALIAAVPVALAATGSLPASEPRQAELPHRFTAVWHEPLTAAEIADIQEWCRRTNERGAAIPGGAPWQMVASEWGHLSLLTPDWNRMYFDIVTLLAECWRKGNLGRPVRFSVWATTPRDPLA